MDKKEFHEFIQAQIQEILKYKYLESEKLGYDIGELRAGIEWVKKYAASFKKNWENERK